MRKCHCPFQWCALLYNGSLHTAIKTVRRVEFREIHTFNCPQNPTSRQAPAHDDKPARKLSAIKFCYIGPFWSRYHASHELLNLPCLGLLFALWLHGSPDIVLILLLGF